MMQIHTTPIRQQDWQRLQPTVYFMTLFALTVLAGSSACVCIAAIANQFLLALTLCLVLAGISAGMILLGLLHEKESWRTLLRSLTSACRAVLDGENTARFQLSPVQREEETLVFGKTLNQLLDGYTYLQEIVQARQQDLLLLHDQMEQLLFEMKPVMDGDLRTRNTLTEAEGPLGGIASMCNTLVEDTARLIQWARSLPEQIIQTSYRLMDLSLELAQMMDTFVGQHRAITASVEELMASALRVESALFSNVEIFQTNWRYLQQSEETSLGGEEVRNGSSDSQALPANPLATSGLFHDLPGQIKSLEQVSQKIREITTLAEQTIKELRAIEQRLLYTNGVVVQFASTISSLATLADNLRQSADCYALPVSAEEAELFGEAEPVLVASPGK
jgi:methyl-accepting chemotaxis protein